MTTVQIKITDPETCKTQQIEMVVRSLEELKEKLDKAYNKCFVEVLDKK